jgi:hypothetical protein
MKEEERIDEREWIDQPRRGPARSWTWKLAAFFRRLPMSRVP